MITDFSALISTPVKIGQFQTINESKMSIVNVHHINDRALLEILLWHTDTDILDCRLKIFTDKVLILEPNFSCFSDFIMF